MNRKYILINLFLVVAAGAFFIGKNYGSNSTWKMSENMHFTDRAAMIKVQLALLKQINAGNIEKVKQLITGGVDIELGVLSRYADIPVAQRDNYVIEAITIAHNFRNKYPHETNKDLVGPIAKTLPLVDPSYKDPYN